LLEIFVLSYLPLQKTWISPLKDSLWKACNLIAFIHSSTGPVVHPFASRHEKPRFSPQGVIMWNRDSPVSVVLLQVLSIYFFIVHFRYYLLLLRSTWTHIGPGQGSYLSSGIHASDRVYNCFFNKHIIQHGYFVTGEDK
jgi:hypothetical protein